MSYYKQGERKMTMRSLVFISLLICSAFSQNDLDTPAYKWLTLNGEEPLVIARGGFSGLFPESSPFANEMAVQLGPSNMVLFCNLLLTKDGIGICSSNILLDNSTTIALVYPKAQKTYNVNGKELKGWFANDYTSDELFSKVSLTQNTYSRPSLFDGLLPIAAVDDVTGVKPPQFWLNVQYDAFYTEHNLSATSYSQKALRLLRINYLSSPEIKFLKSMNGSVNKARTKLVFQLLSADEVEPTTNEKYGSLAQNLTFIKSFASGILVPKEYIWPVNAEKYLETPTSLVIDAHNKGLEVYASGFANDIISSYNYSYDPSAEYLQFIDNGQFAVDGFLTDFPPTATEAIECFAHNGNGTKPKQGEPLIITSNGASGIYPGCSDLSYQQAVDDGADIIDCSVQLSKDGVAFCLDTVDLMGDTTAITSFMSRSSTVPEIQSNPGIFSFDLTWTEIQSLKPQLVSPFLNTAGFERNPAKKNKGKFMMLSEFLDFAKTKAVTGVLINIENAAYLASNKGLDLVGTVTTALSNATFDTQSTQKVLIQSDDTSVLSRFKNVPSYTRVLSMKEKIGDAPKQSVEEIQKFADAVSIPRASIIKVSDYFTTGVTHVVEELHAANLSVYVSVLRNEYVTLAFDYYSDPIQEICTYVLGIGVDGIITEYPGTATKYLRSPCTDTDTKANVPYTILPTQPGSLLELVPAEVKPPAEAPNPSLEVADVIDPPLPPVSVIPAADPDSKADDKTSGALAYDASLCLSLVVVMVLSLLSMGC